MSKILLSTDIGSDIDDALALQVMFNHPGIDLRGIYTVNDRMDVRPFIAKHIVNLTGRDIPVVKGESRALSGINPYYYFEDCVVDDEYIDEEESECSSDVVLKPFEKVGITSDGGEDLASRLEKERHVVFSIAPLTNVAKLLQEHPESTNNIERLYVMGCRFPDDNERVLEHNVKYDADAANLVFESDIPITIVTGNLCEKYRMPSEMLEQLEGGSGKYVKKMARSFLATKTAQKFISTMIQGINLEDLLRNHIKVGKGLINVEDMDERLKLYKMKDSLLVNLNDLYFAALSGDEYFEQFNALIEHLKDSRLDYKEGDMIVEALRGLVPKNISIADVYVPYCYLHPNKLKIDKGIIRCDREGGSYLSSGDKHEIITDIDYEDFKEFLGEYLK